MTQNLNTSMKNLTNSVLYNDNDELIFDNLNEQDMRQIGYFVNELDNIYSDLIDIMDRISSYKIEYNTYCSRLLKLCDDKNKLSEMFLDYYEEYILMLPKEKSKKCNKRGLFYTIPVQNRFSLLE